MSSKGHDKFRAAIQNQPPTAVARELGTTPFLVLSVASGREPKVSMALAIQRRYGIQVSDWATEHAEVAG